MKYKIVPSAKFRKDLKLAIRRGYNLSLLDEVVENLANGKMLLEKYHDHILTGEYVGCRECHITPDWLLVYQISADELLLYLTRTGSHADLF